MCGRFTLTADLDTLRETFGVTIVPDTLSARYNIAPSQPVPAITNENPQELTFLRWGLIPSWAKDPKIGYKMINARGETVHEKPSFRTAFKRRRCLIPADGFFEWQRRDGDKVPQYIHLKDRGVFAMAGLWEVWHSPEGGEVRTCAIITTTPNSLTASIHDRMPVILARQDYETWLSPGEQASDALKKLIRPYDADLMDVYEVSKIVNKPGNDIPACIEPVA